MTDSLTQILMQASEAYKAGEYARAHLLYRSLAEQDHCESQVFVGWMLYAGKGVAENRDAAVVWFQKSAALGYPRGAFYLGRSLTAASKHLDAFNWYQTAATGGYVPAIFRLGLAYAYGKGTSKSLSKAYQYLTEAKKQGHIYAYREITLLDMRGNRGLLRRLAGLFGFIYIVFWGTLITSFNPTSEKLAG
jgi:TPR repeat protein